jgi:hypothetical protein
MKPFETVRDVLVLRPEEAEGNWLVTAVDSCGAIGEKPGDALRVPPEVAAAHTVRVALLEVACTGAVPVFGTLSVCNDPETGDRLLAGVRQSTPQLPVVMSTEKNMPTSMSAFGISVTGVCKSGELRLGRARAGDRLFCAGTPLMGGEVLAPHAAVFTLAHLAALLADKRVHAVIPCGSGGIMKEAQIIAAESLLTAAIDADTGLDLAKSAGPATCAVFAAALPPEHDFQLSLPVTCIGRLLSGKTL